MSNYYTCILGKIDIEDEYPELNLAMCIRNNVFLIHQGAGNKGAIEYIEEGDILILQYNNHYIAYGKAISGLDKTIDYGDGWNHSVKVNRWITGASVHKYGIKGAQEGGSIQYIVKKVNKDFALGKLEEIGLLF